MITVTFTKHELVDAALALGAQAAAAMLDDRHVAAEEYALVAAKLWEAMATTALEEWAAWDCAHYRGLAQEYRERAADARHAARTVRLEAMLDELKDEEETA